MISIRIDRDRAEIELDGESRKSREAIREIVTGIHSVWCMLNAQDPHEAAVFRAVLRDMAEDDDVWDPSLADVETAMEVDSIEDLMEGWNEE